MQKKNLLGNAILFLTAIVWGTAFVYQRTGMDYIQPFTFGASRMYLAAFALFILVVINDNVQKKKGNAPKDRMSPAEYEAYKKNTLKGGIIIGCALTVASSFQQAGIQYTTAGKAGFITALYMLLVPIIGRIFLKQKLSWLCWVGVFVGTIGMYLLCIKEDFTVTKGDALEMCCAVCFAIHILCCDHFSDKADPLRISMMQFAIMAVLSTVLAFIFEEPTWPKIASAAVPICFCGLLSGGLGYTLQIIGQKYTDPAVGALIMSLESVFSAIAGWLILHESMSPRELTGCIIMFAAIVLVQIPVPERKKGKA